MKRLILPTMILALNLNSQELDKDFMNSLPDDIRRDLIEKNSQQSLNTNENYRPYLYSSKLSKAEEIINLKDRLEKDLLELERRLDSDDLIVNDKELKLYGFDFFNTFQTSFMPINEPNLDSEYILDVGDVLNIQLVGQKNYIEKFIVNRNGSISFPDIGKIVIAGLSLDQASNLIKSRVKESFIGTEAFINIIEIRDVNVLVAGNAKNPGIYTLSGNSNILHAIFAAGGISEYGSLRKISLYRNNILIETLDLYDLLIDAQFNLKKRIRSGDVVFVEARKNIVIVDGAVYRPAQYEVLDEQDLYSVLNYANGIKKTADLKNMSLERILDGTLKSIPIVNESQLKNINAIDGDVIYIRDIPYRKAKISGSVLKPGYYTMAEGESINDLIEKAGGYTANAYPFGAIYTNEGAKEIDRKSKNILYEEFLDNILAISQLNLSGNFDITPIVKLTEEIKNTEVNGRVVIDLLDENPTNKYYVQDGDEIFIPELNNVVYIYGETSNEGAVSFEPGKNVDYFIAKAGGYKSFAETESIYILNPNGESQSYSQKRNIFESSPKTEIIIHPGSVIFVPRKLDDSTPRRLAAQAYVSILGNLGIALASLSSINKN